MRTLRNGDFFLNQVLCSYSDTPGDHLLSYYEAMVETQLHAVTARRLRVRGEHFNFFSINILCNSLSLFTSYVNVSFVDYGVWSFLSKTIIYNVYYKEIYNITQWYWKRGKMQTDTFFYFTFWIFSFETVQWSFCTESDTSTASVHTTSLC